MTLNVVMTRAISAVAELLVLRRYHGAHGLSLSLNGVHARRVRRRQANSATLLSTDRVLRQMCNA